MTEGFDVRRLRVKELEALRAWMPAWNSTEYAKRLAAQDRGELLQVVAWVGEEPVGRAMVLFPGHEEYSASAERERCAEVRDVGVVEDARRRGIGTALIYELERAARTHEMTVIGMMVDIGFEARAGELLYEKLGYQRAHGPFIASTNLFDDNGKRIPVGGVVAYLTKRLSGT